MSKDPAAVALGKKRWQGKSQEDVKETGRLGGLSRAKHMTVEERSKAARKAVQARWAKAKKMAPKKA